MDRCQCCPLLAHFCIITELILCFHAHNKTTKTLGRIAKNIYIYTKQITVEKTNAQTTSARKTGKSELENQSDRILSL